MRATLWGLMLAVAGTVEAQSRPESEPNNTAATANAVQFGDAITGRVPQGDHDYFVLDIAAGTRLDIKVRSRAHNAELLVYGPDGQTLLVRAHHDAFDTVSGPRIRYQVTNTGRYYLKMLADEFIIGPDDYMIAVKAFAPPPPGPGDPVTTFAGNLTGIGGMVAGASGEVFITEGARIARVSSSGVVTTLVASIDHQGALALSEFGDLLVPGCAVRVEVVDDCESHQGVVWRIAPGGAVSRFVEGLDTPGPIEVAPNGDVWVVNADSGTLWHFDPQGTLKETHRNVFYPRDLAFSPSGDLIYISGHNLVRLGPGTPDVISQYVDGGSPLSLAFDRDGYLYVAATEYYNQGRIVLLDPQYRVVTPRFAQLDDHFGFSRTGQLVFTRDANGTMTTRLLALHEVRDVPDLVSGSWRVLEEIAELDRSAIRAPGWPVGVQGSTTVAVSVGEITVALMGGPPLTAAQIQFLDSLGNKNGVLDVGDLRAYLRSQGELTVTQP